MPVAVCLRFRFEERVKIRALTRPSVFLLLGGRWIGGAQWIPRRDGSQ
jgi:hypothetical protein